MDLWCQCERLISRLFSSDLIIRLSMLWENIKIEPWFILTYNNLLRKLFMGSWCWHHPWAPFLSNNYFWSLIPFSVSYNVFLPFVVILFSKYCQSIWNCDAYYLNNWNFSYCISRFGRNLVILFQNVVMRPMPSSK